MRRTTASCLMAVAVAFGSAEVRAQAPPVRAVEPTEPQWIGASGGGIPSGAVAYGHEADGREQFACRGAQGGGIHLGKITQGFSGCNIGYGGREITLADYEVLVLPQRARRIAARSRMSSTVSESPLLEARAVQAAEVPSIAPRSGRGFDDDGQPYVEETMPDGSIKRTTQSGVTITKPDGTSKFYRLQRMTINAPAATPPELPANSQGRLWIEEHNGQLLVMIRELVKNDAAQMKKFTDAERQATSDDVFAQIANRTRIATFLAQSR